MTTIVIFGELATIPGIYDGTEALVNYHVDATGARVQSQLEARLIGGRPAQLTRLSEHWPLSEYKAVINQLNTSRQIWSIRDDRLLLFLPEFAEIAGEVRLLWVDTVKPVTLHQKTVHKLTQEVYDKFEGVKLVITDKDAPIDEVLK